MTESVSRVRYVAQVLLVALGYVLAANLGRAAASYSIVTAVWPPSGYALAVLLMAGVRYWPGVTLGVLVTVGVHQQPVPPPIQLPLAAELAMAFGNTCEAVLGALLLRRLTGPPGCFGTVRQVLGLLLFPVGVGASVSATFGVASLYAIGAVPWALLPDTWWTWWVGNALGIIVVTPFLTCWWSLPPPRPGRARLLEVSIVLALAVLMAAHAVLGMFPSVPRATREAYLLFPFLIWAALRLGPRGAVTAIFAVSTLALASTAFRYGHFAGADMSAVVLRLQVFVGVMSATILLLAASVAERKRAFDELHHLKDGLEDLVRRRTADLEASNRDLEAFAFEVSHDLRGPLRAVNGYTAMLVQDHAAEMSPAARSLLDRVARSAARMGQLIEALLDYARVGRAGLHVTDVDVEDLVRSALADVLAVHHGPPVQVTVRELPAARADPAMLRQVLTNLLENGVKYTRTRAEPHVEVGAEVVDGVTAYYVRDNGVGFDMRSADRLFRVFSRLHGDAFEGTGIGLAIVARIVAQHGGRVWAEGAPGEGATFWFTLEPPRASAPN